MRNGRFLLKMTDVKPKLRSLAISCTATTATEAADKPTAENIASAIFANVCNLQLILLTNQAKAYIMPTTRNQFIYNDFKLQVNFLQNNTLNLNLLNKRNCHCSIK